MGFQTVLRKGITLDVGSAPVIDFQLPVGRAEQTVNVEAAVSQVETTTSAMSSLVDTTQMRELPLNGRNFEQLVLLAPGAVAYTAGPVTALIGRNATFSVAGSRPEGQAILLDGEDLQNWWQRGSGAGVTGTSLGIEAIAEFQALTNTYSASRTSSNHVRRWSMPSGTERLLLRGRPIRRAELTRFRLASALRSWSLGIKSPGTEGPFANQADTGLSQPGRMETLSRQ
jgi:hypothetical protein